MSGSAMLLKCGVMETGADMKLNGYTALLFQFDRFNRVPGPSLLRVGATSDLETSPLGVQAPTVNIFVPQGMASMYSTSLLLGGRLSRTSISVA